MGLYSFSDCFANDGEHKCAALNAKWCDIDGICPFYKPIDQELDELKKYNGEVNLNKIIKKYEGSVTKKIDKRCEGKMD